MSAPGERWFLDEKGITNMSMLRAMASKAAMVEEAKAILRSPDGHMKLAVEDAAHVLLVDIHDKLEEMLRPPVLTERSGLQR